MTTRSRITRLRTADRVEAPTTTTMEPHAQSEDVLEKMELLWTALMGLHFRAEVESLDQAAVAPVLHLAGDLRTDLINNELHAARAAASPA